MSENEQGVQNDDAGEAVAVPENTEQSSGEDVQSADESDESE